MLSGLVLQSYSVASVFLVVIELVVVAVEPTGFMYVTHKGGSGWKPRLDYGCCGDQGELFYHGFNMRGV